MKVSKILQFQWGFGDFHNKRTEFQKETLNCEKEAVVEHYSEDLLWGKGDSVLMKRSQKDVAAMLGEKERQASVRQQIRGNHAKRGLYEKQEPTR